MHAIKFNLLESSCRIIDKRICKTLFDVVETLTRCKCLSIFGLGRELNRAAKVKHNIKCVDRLFGNQTLHIKSLVFYRGMTQLLLRGNKRPVIIVDWSGLTRCGAYHFLRASVAVGGRTLTLYDQAYSLKDYGSDKTHRQFLKILRSIMPENCKPIIVTDAGFRNTWFRAVRELGCDFIGRVRNKTYFRLRNTRHWQLIQTIFPEATVRAKYLGEVLLAKTSPILCHFYLMKNKKMNRVKRNLAGKKVQCSVSKKHAEGAKEPWLIASSLSLKEMSAKAIMLLYKKRMQIEEAFRDLKNTRNGFSLRHCRSYKLQRLNIALLIAALAMLLLWILGTAAKQRHLHFSFQANTEKRWNVLSNFTIGWQALKRSDIVFSKHDWVLAVESIVSSARMPIYGK